MVCYQVDTLLHSYVSGQRDSPSLLFQQHPGIMFSWVSMPSWLAQVSRYQWSMKKGEPYFLAQQLPTGGPRSSKGWRPLLQFLLFQCPSQLPYPLLLASFLASFVAPRLGYVGSCFHSLLQFFPILYFLQVLGSGQKFLLQSYPFCYQQFLLIYGLIY